MKRGSELIVKQRVKQNVKSHMPGTASPNYYIVSLVPRGRDECCAAPHLGKFKMRCVTTDSLDCLWSRQFLTFYLTVVYNHMIINCWKLIKKK